MTLRRKLIAWGAVALVVVALAVAAIPRAPYPCRATFERVRVGMTRAEVYATVGGPPGNYSTGQTLWVPVGPGPHAEEWGSDDAFLDVWFEGGRAKAVEVTDPPQPPTPFFTRLRRWFGL